MPDTIPVESAVTLRMVYLARLRDALGCDHEALPVAGAAPTVARVLALLRARGGAWAQELAPGRAVRVAVNHELVGEQAPVGHNDEVALLPPVTGG